MIFSGFQLGLAGGRLGASRPEKEKGGDIHSPGTLFVVPLWTEYIPQPKVCQGTLSQLRGGKAIFLLPFQVLLVGLLIKLTQDRQTEETKSLFHIYM